MNHFVATHLNELLLYFFEKQAYLSWNICWYNWSCSAPPEGLPDYIWERDLLPWGSTGVERTTWNRGIENMTESTDKALLPIYFFS